MSAIASAPAAQPRIVAVPVPRPEPSDQVREAASEEKRWVLMLAIPFLVGATFFAAAIGTGALWLMGPAMLFGVGVIIASFIYLGLSSDTNSET